MGGQTFDCQPNRPCRILATPLDPTRCSKLMTNRLFKTCSAWCAVAAFALAAPVEAAAQGDLEALQDEAVAWLQEYIGINTINPPGNETRGAEFFAEIESGDGPSLTADDHRDLVSFVRSDREQLEA